MGERLKDLIYDFSDIIISLVIITLIFGVVSWKISDSMAYNAFTEEAGAAALSKKDDAPKTNNSDNTQTTVSSNTDNNASANNAATTTGAKPSASDQGQANANNGTSGTTNNTTPPTTQTTTTQAPPSGDFKIDIPMGTSGIGIAKILKEKGIISDTKMFITRVDQLKLGSRLKAGTFTIKSGSSLDDVIYTLTGKKK